VTAPLLETHAWIWWVRDQDARLGARTIDALDRLPRAEPPVAS
jgi:PIN domain nuclease of toxin-antitoxin system